MATDAKAFTLRVTVVNATGLKHLNFSGDATYCTCVVKRSDPSKQAAGFRTATVQKNALNPSWEETQEIPNWYAGEELEFVVYNEGLLANRVEGRATVPSARFHPSSGIFDTELPLAGLDDATLRVQIQVLGVSSKFARAVFDRDGDGRVSWEEVAETLKEELGKIQLDAPVVLGFSLACWLVHIITTRWWSSFTQDYFALWPWIYSSPKQLMFYPRLVTHIFGHGGWDHLAGNLTLIILVGPSCEAGYGARLLMLIMLQTALVTALFHYLFSPSNAMQLGASGIAFMLIILNSMRDHQAGKIRVSLIVLMVVWVAKEAAGFVSNASGHFDGVSHQAHLFGALVGGISGFFVKDVGARDSFCRLCKRIFVTLTTRPSSSESAKDK